MKNGKIKAALISAGVILLVFFAGQVIANDRLSRARDTSIDKDSKDRDTVIQKTIHGGQMKQMALLNDISGKIGTIQADVKWLKKER